MKWRNNVAVALFAAALCALSPWALPLGAVPVTLGTLGVYLAAALLGLRRGTAAVGLYLLLGALGVPVFAGFTGGFQQLAGLTGGYLWGYLLCAGVIGLLLRCSRRPALLPVWLTLGTMALYAVGTGWYLWQSGGTVGAALLVCVVPFLPADAAKIAVATGLILPLRGRMDRLLKEDVYL